MLREETQIVARRDCRKVGKENITVLASDKVQNLLMNKQMNKQDQYRYDDKLCRRDQRCSFML